MKPRIEDTSFGSITIDGRTLAHDVGIRLDGEVKKRKKKLLLRNGLSEFPLFILLCHGVWWFFFQIFCTEKGHFLTSIVTGRKTRYHPQ